MATPTIASVGAFNDASTGSLTVTLPAHQADDILVVFHETNVSTGSSTPSGWAHVTGSPRSQGSNVVALSVLWKRATSSSETNPVFTGLANHQMGVAIAARGCVTSGDPWDFTPVDYGVAATSLSVPGGTTTVTNTRTFVAIANSADSLVDQISAVSNASLTGFAVVDQEFTDMGNGGGVGVWSGTRTSTGSTGTTSATVVSGSSAALVFALVGASGTTQSLSGTVAATTDATGTITLLADTAGTVATSTTATGTPLLLAGLGGTVAATSATTATPTARIGVTGSAAAVSGVAGDIGTTAAGPTTYALTGTIAATSSVSGTIASRLSLGGTLAAVTTAAGAITALKPVTGTIAAVTAATGTIRTLLGLAGTTAGTSAATGTPAARLGLGGIVDAITNLVGAITGGSDTPSRDITIVATLDPRRITTTSNDRTITAALDDTRLTTHLEPSRIDSTLDPARLTTRMETT